VIRSNPGASVYQNQGDQSFEGDQEMNKDRESMCRVGRRNGMSGRRGPRGMWCRRRQRAPHDVGERCTSTPHTARKRTALARTARAGTAGAHNASMGSASAHNASMHSKRMYSRYTQREHGGHKHDNAGMHSASTKHGPVHPRDVDDDAERMAHDLSERCTSAPHAQHEGAQLEHGMHSASTKHGPGHPRDVDDDDERMSHDLSERCTSAPHAQHEDAQLEHAPHGHAQQAWARARTCRRHTERTNQLGDAGANPARGATRPRARPAHHQRWAPEPPAAAARRPARPHRGPPAAALHPGTRVEPLSGARPQALQQCAVGRPRTAKPPCPSDAAPRQARDRRTAHRRRLQPRPRPRHPIAIYFRPHKHCSP